MTTRRQASCAGCAWGCRAQYFVPGMEPGVEARVREAVAALAAAGAEIVDIDLPHTHYGLATYYIIAPAEASANLARYDGIRYGHSIRGGDVLADYLATRGSGFGAEVKRRIMLGTYALSAGYYDAYYLKALKVRTLIKGDFDRAFESVDALVAPTTPTVAFELGARVDDPVAMYQADACTLPVNVAGLAGLSRALRPLRRPAGRPAVHRQAVRRADPVPARPGVGSAQRGRALEEGRADGPPTAGRPDHPATGTRLAHLTRRPGLSGLLHPVPDMRTRGARVDPARPDRARGTGRGDQWWLRITSRTGEPS